LKVQRQGNEAELSRLEAQVGAVKDLDRVEGNLMAFCDQVRQRVAALGFDEQRLALQALEIKAVATEASVRVQGVVVNESELDILTIEQTSA
jgi:hypothetical protein